MREYGLFSDEGLVEGDFYSVEDAEKARLEQYSPEDELRVEVVRDDEEDDEEEDEDNDD